MTACDVGDVDGRLTTSGIGATVSSAVEPGLMEGLAVAATTTRTWRVVLAAGREESDWTYYLACDIAAGVIYRQRTLPLPVVDVRVATKPEDVTDRDMLVLVMHAPHGQEAILCAYDDSGAELADGIRRHLGPVGVPLRHISSLNDSSGLVVLVFDLTRQAESVPDITDAIAAAIVDAAAARNT